jgi:hypothetical protein
MPDMRKASGHRLNAPQSKVSRMPSHTARFAAIALAALGMSRPAGAATNPFVGSWHLDRARSHLTGTTLRIARTPTGYHFDVGAATFDLPDNGRFATTVPGRSTSLKALNDHEFLRIHRDHGHDVDHSLLQISADQQTLTIETDATTPSGAIRHSQDIERRVGPGHGLAGTWRSTQSGLHVADTLTITALPGGRLQWGAPEDGNYFILTPNGPAATNQGPRAVASVQLTLRTTSATGLRWTETLAGKPYMEGMDTLAPDGSLTETTWPDQFPAEKQQAVYHRQNTGL